VATAGNEAGRRTHFHGTIVQNQQTDCFFFIRDRVVQLDFWLSGRDAVDAHVVDPGGQAYEVDGEFKHTPYGDPIARGSTPSTGDLNIQIRIVTADTSVTRWRLRISAGTVVDGRLDGWRSSSSGRGEAPVSRTTTTHGWWWGFQIRAALPRGR
jgi:hypothetical protein